jgi:rfaE bifunctional protein nucleotidyltransferase chain/domain
MPGDDALARIARLPRPLVMTNGVFDLLHRGHVAYLEAARALGASLVVAVNSDASVKRLGKGDDRPLNTLEDRMAVVAALRCVDLAVAFDDDTPRDLIVAAMPDVLVKGGDYTADTTAGRPKSSPTAADSSRFPSSTSGRRRRSWRRYARRSRYNRAMEQHQREVDARGLNCPLPILRTKKMLNDMKSGELVQILATDPASVRDFQAFARQTGNELVEHGERDGAFYFLLKRR